MSTIPQSAEQLREEVRAHYAKAAVQVLGSPATSPTSEASCCGPSCCGPSQAALSQSEKVSSAASACCGTEIIDANAITSDLYSQLELGEVPVAAALASLGCGNPTALAELHAGERVLDLGSGGGIDVLLSARRVGPSGFAYGLDMTDEMLELAEKNRTHLLFLPPYSPELQPAEHLWPLTNSVLINRHFTSIDELEEVQLARCAALQQLPAIIRSTTCFHWWPRQIHKRRGPRRREYHLSVVPDEWSRGSEEL
jgi:SAM-dependent methyltransferase